MWVISTWLFLQCACIVKADITLVVGHQILVTVVAGAHRWSKNFYWVDFDVFEGFKHAMKGTDFQ